MKPSVSITPYHGHKKESVTGLFQPTEAVEIVTSPQHQIAGLGILKQGVQAVGNRCGELLIGGGAKGAGVVTDLYADVNYRRYDADAAKLTLGQVVAAGVIGAALFIAALLGVVYLVTHFAAK